jgi:hypothetical protein
LDFNQNQSWGRIVDPETLLLVKEAENFQNPRIKNNLMGNIFN